MHLGRNTTYEWLLSQPVSALSSFNAVIDGVFKKKPFYDGGIIFHLKTILRMLYILLQVKKGLIEIIVKFRAEKILCTHLPCTKCPFQENKISCRKTIAMFIWKWKGSFQVHTLISEKSIPRCIFLLCGARRHQKSQQRIDKTVYQKFHFLQPLNYTHVN